MDSKKRPISPTKDLDVKKVKTEQDEISFSTSPTLKTRTIKVIPPKSPSKEAEPSFKISVQETVDKPLLIQKIVTVGDGKVAGEKVGLGLSTSPPKSPVKLTKTTIPTVSVDAPKSPVKVTEKTGSNGTTGQQQIPEMPKSPTKPTLSKDQNEKSAKNADAAKVSPVDRAKKVAATLETMEFKSPRAQILAMIQEAEKSRKGESIIVNDSRLTAPLSTNNVFLGILIL